MLTPGSVQPLLGALASGIQACIRKSVPVHPEDDGVRVYVTTTGYLQIGPDGKVTSSWFDPPLRREAQGCANSQILSAKFPPAKNPSKLQLSIKL